jgi:hypothetical protein
MVKLTKQHILLGKKLHRLKGKATGDELECTYPDIEPLIRHRYVRVENWDGIAAYIMTPEGLAWADALK